MKKIQEVTDQNIMDGNGRWGIKNKKNQEI